MGLIMQRQVKSKLLKKEYMVLDTRRNWRAEGESHFDERRRLKKCAHRQIYFSSQ